MILVKTETGQRVLKDRSIPLSPRQRTAFILFDGKRTIADVLQAGMGVTSDDVDQMVAHGLLGPVGGENGAAPVVPVAPVLNGATHIGVPTPSVPAPVSAPVLVEAAAPSNPARSNQQRYKDAYPIATQITGGLGLRGFRLNLSVEGTSTYEQLLDLLPKIQAAVGAEKAAPLERALLGH